MLVTMVHRSWSPFWPTWE